MTLAEISVKRPVLAFMLSAMLVLFGYISYKRIAVDRFPQVEFPMISIFTSMVGAQPNVIESSITSVLETAVNTVPGIDNLTSYSRPSSSLIILKFDLSKNIDIAFNEVQAKINQALSNLPKEAQSPIVQKLQVGSTPIMWLALHGDRTIAELNDFVKTNLKKKLETIDGVGELQISGEQQKAIRVALDLQRMAAFAITTQDIVRAFQQEHVQIPGGYIKSKDSEHLLNLDLEYHDANSLKKLIVSYKDKLPITINDIASVSESAEDVRQIATYNSKAAIGLGIVKVSGANTVQIIDTVKSRLQSEILTNLPPGINLTIVTDEANTINDIIDALKEHLILGTILASIVVLLFLQNIRSTLIIATTIPISLFGAIAGMYYYGFTFNVLTLLALLLLIGVVVDDAIVVLENIYRKMQNDPSLTKRQATIIGSKQVFFAILAASLTLVCIFVPVVFMGGIIGRFFQSFAVVVAIGVIVSFFVAITLTPMLCSQYLNVINDKNKFFQFCEKIIHTIELAYTQAIHWALTHRKKVIIMTIAVICTSYFILGNVGKEFMAETDDGEFIINFNTPLGSSINYTNEKLQEIEQALNANKNVAAMFSTIGSGSTGRVNEGQIFVTLKPKVERFDRQSKVIKDLSLAFEKLAGVQAFPSHVSIVGGGRGEPLQFVITGPDLQKISTLAHEMLEKLRVIPNIGTLDMSLKLDLPQYTLNLDRERALSLGISSSDVAQTLGMLAGGYNVAKYNAASGDSDRYNIRLKAGDGEISKPSDLSKIFIRNQSGHLVRMDSVAHLETSSSPAIIFKSRLQYGAVFYSTPNITLGEALEKIYSIADELLPAGYSVHLEGQAKEFSATVGYILFAMAMALTMVYMVLASQFNSFIQPVVIMIAQPLAIIGALIALWVTGHTLNIYSMIGMVLLMGLVAKNSILLVDLTNQYRLEGLGIQEALHKACPLRMRPVIMTSLTIILAMLPAALGQGPGSDSNGPLAVAVIGGMISSTLLTLIVIPSFYSLVEEFLQIRKRVNTLESSSNNF